jgi:hypothetical protein
MEDNGCVPNAVTSEIIIRALFENDENDRALKFLCGMIVRVDRFHIFHWLDSRNDDTPQSSFRTRIFVSIKYKQIITFSLINHEYDNDCIVAFLVLQVSQFI